MMSAITMAEIRVLVADTYPLMRHGLRALLAHEGDIRIVGEAEDYDGLLRLREAHQPDIIVLNDTPPDDCPVPVAEVVRDMCLSTQVVILASDDDPLRLRDLVAVGAAGILLKSEPLALLPQAIRAAAAGNIWQSQAVREALEAAPEAGVAALAEMPALTRREREVLALIAEARNNAAIAAEMGVAGQSVRNYATRLYAKLGVGSRAEAMVWARQHGFEASQ